MTDRDKLTVLPCPFCGRPARIIGRNGGKEYRVQCTNQKCEARSKGAIDWHDALERWNKRV